MIIILKILTILAAFALSWIAAAAVLGIPLKFQNKVKKIALFPGILALVVIIFGGIIWVKSYLLESCSGMGCWGMVLWPSIILGVALGVFLVFGFYGLMIKRFSLSNKFIIWGSLIVAIVIMIVLHIAFPVSYAYDANVMKAYKQYDLSHCYNNEIGVGMFMSRGERWSTERSCYRLLALEANDESYCEMLDAGEKTMEGFYDCKNKIMLARAISREKCNGEYDTACIISACRSYYNMNSMLGVFGCGVGLAKEDQKWCGLFGIYPDVVPQCR